MLKGFTTDLKKSEDNVLNNLPGIIDLFCGCGGFALGFCRAGFPYSGGIDIDRVAVQNSLFNLQYIQEDAIHTLSCADLSEMSAEDLNLCRSENCIVLGGPPCQAYSKAGRGKLRSLGKRREHLRDRRGTLYEDFVRMTLEIKPVAILMENVPEAIDYGGLNVAEKVAFQLEENGYIAGWSILNAADYGVPQMRERLFLLAFRDDIAESITFPNPTHFNPVNKDYNSYSRSKRLSFNPHFIIPNKPKDNTQPWVSVSEALSDLPSLFPHSKEEYRYLKPNVLLPYKTDINNYYQEYMRNWAGKKRETVTGNSFRKTHRDFPIFAEMKPGDDYLKASIIADKLFEHACQERGINKLDHPERYRQMKNNIVPPYSRSKFTSKWKRLQPELPSHTLVAHLSVDTYSHIHPWEPRGITIREAARLQSIPDCYLFSCSMGDAFKQIGNAVPPLLAEALAQHIIKVIRREDNV